MKTGKKIYFLSDAHLGLPNHAESLVREKLLVKWLDEIKNDAEEIYLVGDMFDFWFEHKRVVPKGFVRFLGKLSEICDSGIPVHYFTGNHDLWIFNYLPSETGVILHRKHEIREINGKRFFIAHGDALGPNDISFKILKKIFLNKVVQWFFKQLHPNFTMWIGINWSKKSRYNNDKSENLKFLGEEKEHLITLAKQKLVKEHFDFFIFGHRHIPYEFQLNENSKFINLGDWITNFTYAVFDGNEVMLKHYKQKSAL
ncbi:MAG: UDP-2,3-diacylglucosamine hydrolase [Bacteroidetes bacterium CG23_combo_of_CG06-09_8_20_14_all_32_9]|nr:MAG: UDP-2,3-diacylglucosamine hydrolase [Bacteroidetes bacterium CG23_combo_of_CG06-09_8_20_14_all_32_9]